MTIIALRKRGDSFYCYADSLVSFGSSGGLEKYCKVLILPVSFRQSVDEKTHVSHHQLGMAISGNLAAATSVYTILAGTLQSLHFHGVAPPPATIDFVNHAMRVSSEIFEELRHLGRSSLFGFFLFGFDILLSEPFAVKFSTELDASGKYQIVARRCDVNENQISLLGSGETAFIQAMKKDEKDQTPFADLFYEFIKSGEVATVGGLPQLLIASPRGVSIEPVLIGSEDGLDCSVYHSGMKFDGYKSVGQYGIGLQMEGFNMDAFQRSQAIIQAGLDVNDPSLQVGEINRAVLEWRLRVSERSRKKLEYVGCMTLCAPRSLKKGNYLAFNCDECGSLVPVIKKAAKQINEPFEEQLQLRIKCPNCPANFTVGASAFTIYNIQ